MSRHAVAIPFLACALAVSAAAHADPAAAADPVRAAFTRMLERAPAAGTPLAADAARTDPLVEHLLRAFANARRVTSPPSAARLLLAATPNDPVAAAFVRMLGHEAATDAPRGGAAATPDPLTAMLSASLWPGMVADGR